MRRAIVLARRQAIKLNSIPLPLKTDSISLIHYNLCLYTMKLAICSLRKKLPISYTNYITLKMYLQTHQLLSRQSPPVNARVKIMSFRNAHFVMLLYGNRRRKAPQAETELPSSVYAVNRVELSSRPNPTRLKL